MTRQHNTPDLSWRDRLSGRGLLRTLFMPELRLGLESIGTSHGAIVAVIASMFIQAGLLPYNHPARHYDGAINYRLRALMGEAWYNLRHKQAGDVQQYALFGSVFLLFAFAIMAIVTFVAKLVVSAANAQESGVPGGLFSAPHENDLGIKMIEALIGQASRGEGPPVLSALGELLAVYSYGVLVIASFIIAWQLIAVVIDTASTGRFFGGKHNPVWWPIRVVFALGILIPLGNGFNAGQIIVVQLAKWGSNLASNAWNTYAIEVIQDSSQQYLAKQLDIEGAIELYKNLVSLYMCEIATNLYLNDIGASGNQINNQQVDLNLFPIKISNNKQAHYMGNKEDEDLCGSVILTTPKTETIADKWWRFPEGEGDPTVVTDNETLRAVLASLFSGPRFDDLILKINSIFSPMPSQEFGDFGFVLHQSARRFAGIYMATRDPRQEADWGAELTIEDITSRIDIAPEQFFEIFYTMLSAELDEIIAPESGATSQLTDAITENGWPAASLWFYLLSSSNEELADTSKNLPQVNVSVFNVNPKVGWLRKINPFGKSSEEIIEEKNKEYMSAFHAWWDKEIVSPVQIKSITESSPAWFEDYRRSVLKTAMARETDPGDSSNAINKIFDNDKMGNAVDLMMALVDDQEENLHPIAMMAVIGRVMIEFATLSIIGVIGGALTLTVFTATATPLTVIGTVIAVALQTLILVLTLILAPLIIGGVIVSIILPMTPFIRFVTAISGWLIAILEAVVAVPVVALGHLRTDGEGLLGPMLQGAYIIFLQLLLRPVLIVAGLVMSITLVEVTIGFVNDTFFLMLDGLPGPSGWTVNILFMLIRFVGLGVMYFVTVYMLINSSFKIIDLLPGVVSKFLGGPEGGIRDEETGDYSRAIVAGAVFASGAGEGLRGLGQGLNTGRPDTGGDPTGDPGGNQSGGQPSSTSIGDNAQNTTGDTALGSVSGTSGLGAENNSTNIGSTDQNTSSDTRDHDDQASSRGTDQNTSPDAGGNELDNPSDAGRGNTQSTSPNTGNNDQNTPKDT